MIGHQKSEILYPMQFPELTVFSYVVIGVFFLKLIYDLAVTTPIILHKIHKPKAYSPNVSVVICGRNEEENILEFLPQILNQDYPNFEVVFVNDRSIDESHLLLKALEQKHAHLKVTQVKESELHWAGKKFALSIGLKSATNELVVLTDADCYPSSTKWLRTIVAQFSKERRVVLGYGAYKKGKGILNKLIRAEALMICAQYLGYSKLGLPYMGVGRNLAYDRSLFFKNRGFASHQFIASGDDDLFINEVANSKNTEIVFSEDSYTISNPESTFNSWVEQKRRHLTTSNRYNIKTILGLLFSSVIKYAFYILAIAILIQNPLWWIGATVLLLNIISILILNYWLTKTTKSLDILIWIPFTEIFLLLFYPFLFIWNTLASGNPWKNY